RQLLLRLLPERRVVVRHGRIERLNAVDRQAFTNGGDVPLFELDTEIAIHGRKMRTLVGRGLEHELSTLNELREPALVLHSNELLPITPVVIPLVGESHSFERGIGEPHDGTGVGGRSETDFWLLVDVQRTK